MSNRPELPGSNTRGLSNALWGDMPLDFILSHKHSGVGVGMFDDFTSFGGILASTDGAYHSEGNYYLSQQTASCTIIPVAATPTPASVAPTSYGAIAITADTTDGSTCGIAWGASLVSPYHAAPFAVIPGISGDMVFEARFRVNSITAARFNFFIGLCGQAATLPVAADVPITSSDVFATTQSLLGFARMDGAGTAAGTTALDLFYERSGGTVASKDGVGTLALDTYIKAGFKWDGNARTLTPWIDGVEITGSRVSRTTTGATPWPNDYMVPVAVVEEIGTTAGALTLDWWACAQKT